LNVGDVTTHEFPDLNIGLKFYCAVSAYTTSGAISGIRSPLETPPGASGKPA